MLLAVGPSTKCGRYRVSLIATSRCICISWYEQRLYDDSRWAQLIRAFRFAIYNLNSLPTEPLLNLALYSGLASLKLPSCYDVSSHNVDCPVCDPSINILAEEVPYSHHANSTIVCRISGKIMDEDNMPMAFPNGNVYSREVCVALQNSSITTANTHILLSGTRRHGNQAQRHSYLPTDWLPMRLQRTQESIHFLVAYSRESQTYL